MTSSDGRLEDALHRAVLECATDAVFVIDADTDRIIGTNEAATELLERPRREIVGTSLVDLQPGDSQPTSGQAIQTTQGVTRSEETTEYVTTATGTRVPVESSTSTVALDGQQLRIRIVQDISERIERQQDLRGFKTAVEQAGHGIMLTNTEGQIEYVNPAVEAVTGYDKSELIGANPSILQSGEHDEQFYADLWETITSGKQWEGDLINERKNGERYHIHQTIAPVTDDSGEIERFVAINVDISDRKRYERQLEREREQLELFASTVAHDLRNPLGIALGNLDITSRPDEEGPIDKAIDALERMDTMISEILTLSKQGQTVQNPESVRFYPAVRRSWDRVDTHNATLSLTNPTESFTITADPMRFEELLSNLFRNAVKHGGDRVEVTVGRLPECGGFYVDDDGPGIDVEPPNRIFNTGFTTSTEGTGFGLTIVEQIAHAHEWVVSVGTAEDGGARFEFITNSARAAVEASDRRSERESQNQLNAHWDRTAHLESEGGSEPRLWLVERTYDASDRNTAVLTYASTDGDRFVRSERALDSADSDNCATAAIKANPERAHIVEDPDRQNQYALEAQRMREHHDPNEII